MKKSFFKVLLTVSVLILVGYTQNVLAQKGVITGKVIESSSGQPMAGVAVFIKGSKKIAITDSDGNYSLTSGFGKIKLTATFLGFAKIEKDIYFNASAKVIDFVMEEDLFNLDEIIVTGVFDERSKLQSSVSISTLEQQQVELSGSRQITDVVKQLPGFYVDGSSGEVLTRVYSRGVSASASWERGWYYTSLQEDGLPVSVASWFFNGPDFYYRSGSDIGKVEAVRGGSAAITTANSPGGIINFISPEGSDEFKGFAEIKSGAYDGTGNLLNRIDIGFGGPMGNNWYYHIGGFGRTDQGAREIDLKGARGAQVKANFKKVYGEENYVKVYGKYLNDHTLWWTEIPVQNFDAPEGVGDFNLLTSSTLPEPIRARLPDGRQFDTNPNAVRDFDNNDIIHNVDQSLGLDFKHVFANGLGIRNNVKYSVKSAEQAINLVTSNFNLNEFPLYGLTTAGRPLFGGEVTWNIADTKEEVAKVFIGVPTGDIAETPVNIASSSLPLNKVMGTGNWYIASTQNELIENLSLNKKIGKNSLSAGFYYAFSDTEFSELADVLFMTFEPNPRRLTATLRTLGGTGEEIALTDPNGITRQSGSIYINSRAEEEQIAFYAGDLIDFGNVNIDLGLRYESINHKGSNDGFTPLSRLSLSSEQLGGFDKDVSTGYDNGVFVENGILYEFDYTYDYLSYSVGLNVLLSDAFSLFGRFSSGNKAPDLGYYYHNFSNVAIPKGEVERVFQTEVGMKLKSDKMDFFLTGFLVNTDNIFSPNVIIPTDPSIPTYFPSPTLFGESAGGGLEVDAKYYIGEKASLQFSGVYQRIKATDWNYWSANDLNDRDDDQIIDASGNDLPFNPNLIVNITPTFYLAEDKLNIYANGYFVSEQFANIPNGFKLPAYAVLGLGVSYNISEHVTLGLNGTNLLNTIGASFFQNTEGQLAPEPEVVTREFVQSRPNTTFYLRGQLPRLLSLRLKYNF